MGSCCGAEALAGHRFLIAESTTTWAWLMRSTYRPVNRLGDVIPCLTGRQIVAYAMAGIDHRAIAINWAESDPHKITDELLLVGS